MKNDIIIKLDDFMTDTRITDWIAKTCRHNKIHLRGKHQQFQCMFKSVEINIAGTCDFYESVDKDNDPH